MILRLVHDRHADAAEDLLNAGGVGGAAAVFQDGGEEEALLILLGKPAEIGDAMGDEPGPLRVAASLTFDEVEGVAERAQHFASGWLVVEVAHMSNRR